MNKIFPDSPGVYFFKNEHDCVIYIGKAKSLKKRIQSHFRPNGTDEKLRALIDEHVDIEYILTKNETEALLLEAQLIKKHQPKHNILLKQGEPYVYLQFTQKSPSTMEIVRNKKTKGRYFGPFLHKKQARAVYNFLSNTFRLYICNKKIAHGCLEYHIDLCAGSCKSNFDNDEYLLRLKLAQDTLKKNHKQFSQRIKKQIEHYNTNLSFEKSKRLNKYLENIETIFETLETRFSEKKFKDAAFAVTTPNKHLTKNYSEVERELQKLLAITSPIKTIDCFDISHFQSSSLVGSCVRFFNGAPDKNNFRRFKIKTLIQQDDYAALQEIILRRYKDTACLPDLILIDGGKGQLNASRSVLPDIPCISLAKKEETIFSFATPNGIKLDPHNKAAQLLIALRDYAHHFAISYHKLRRKKAFLP